MKSINLAIFLSLNGKAEEAISFYQSVFDGKILFKITNKEFQEKLNPALVIAKGKENYISHSVVQIGNIQLQIADNPVYEGMTFHQGNALSFSVLAESVATAKKLFHKISHYQHSKVINAPVENEFADFYTIIQDPFGVIIQISKEKQPDPERKGTFDETVQG